MNNVCGFCAFSPVDGFPLSHVNAMGDLKSPGSGSTANVLLDAHSSMDSRQRWFSSIFSRLKFSQYPVTALCCLTSRQSWFLKIWNRKCARCSWWTSNYLWQWKMKKKKIEVTWTCLLLFNSVTVGFVLVSSSLYFLMIAFNFSQDWVSFLFF